MTPLFELYQRCSLKQLLQNFEKSLKSTHVTFHKISGEDKKRSPCRCVLDKFAKCFRKSFLKSTLGDCFSPIFMVFRNSDVDYINNQLILLTYLTAWLLNFIILKKKILL